MKYFTLDLNVDGIRIMQSVNDCFFVKVYIYAMQLDESSSKNKNKINHMIIVLPLQITLRYFTPFSLINTPLFCSDSD